MAGRTLWHASFRHAEYPSGLPCTPVGWRRAQSATTSKSPYKAADTPDPALPSDNPASPGIPSFARCAELLSCQNARYADTSIASETLSGGYLPHRVHPSLNPDSDALQLTGAKVTLLRMWATSEEDPFIINIMLISRTDAWISRTHASVSGRR